ncbi:hypothetical protein D9M70_530300 [compost metagenome]
MQVGRARYKLPFACGAFGQPEPTEEEEDVVRPDAMTTQMALCGTGLPQRRAPVGQTRGMLAAKVGIEVNACVKSMPTCRQIAEYLVQRFTREVEVRQGCAVMHARNRQRDQAAVRQDRAGHAAVLRIEALAG